MTVGGWWIFSVERVCRCLVRERVWVCVVLILLLVIVNMGDPSRKAYPLTVDGARCRVIDQAKYLAEPHSGVLEHSYRLLCLHGAVSWLNYAEGNRRFDPL